MLTWHLGRKKLISIIIIITIISLLSSEWAAHNYASANFYLAPTRAWELLAGSLRPLLLKKGGQKKQLFVSVRPSHFDFLFLAFQSKNPIPAYIP